MTPTELRKLHGKVTRKWVVNDFAEDCCQFTFDEAEYLVAAVNSLPALLNEIEQLRKVREAARLVQLTVTDDGKCIYCEVGSLPGCHHANASGTQALRAALTASEEGK